MAMFIDADVCTSCGDCEPECPEGAIRKTKMGTYEIVADRCTECEDQFDMPRCEEVCEADGAIQPID
ncbi:4Fe-4S binding protein [Halorhodospira halochloris]|uniref:4Fe-4S ferredoxin n=1 Tax=Halorhodospira halochloris TaxID=1052 RepID=A0A0X8X9F6_HALHR|nr:4Fe-4S binding protein [Halorhodospira halochloris]MBK1652632.1 ferredoxin [Halorhodospira halochloris]MCG5530527.1 4Fe-4S binding protein [Halorhodospira halochloris]MCG5548815.1 4Fe-4S binding protein [Halorhodospira halochloris]BAU57916.1 4Fe-4S ferredoxin [Halorhodospira halochloris]